MDEFEEAALNIGQGLRNLRDLIDAERERQETASADAGDDATTGDRGGLATG